MTTDTPEPGAASVAERERVAQIVYEAMWQAADYAGKPDPKDREWQPRGNSQAQEDARRFAIRILALTPPSSTGAEVERLRKALPNETVAREALAKQLDGQNDHKGAGAVRNRYACIVDADDAVAAIVAILALAPIAAEPARGDAVPFQAQVQPWLMACFGEIIAGDREERNHRFLEEALELVQSCGCTASEAHQLVDYVFGRPAGDPPQEVGGVMVTLAALCLANDLDMHAAGWVELNRIWGKVEQIRAKQAAKPEHSPLPEGAKPNAGQAADGVADA